MARNEIPTQPLCEARLRQAMHIGYIEMERIVEEVIVTEFNRIGELLMENDYKVELVLYDTMSDIDDKLYVCGAKLSIKRGYMRNSITYTGNPQYFQFVLQTRNFASRTTQETVEYHRLTPQWFHSRVKHFLKNTFREVDLTHLDDLFTDKWDNMEGPFSIKIKNDYGYYNEIAKAESLERAFHISSYAAEAHYAEEDLIVMDRNGTEVG